MTVYRPMVSDNNIRIKECTTAEYEKNMELFPSLVENNLEYSVLDNKGASLIDVKDQ